MKLSVSCSAWFMAVAAVPTAMASSFLRTTTVESAVSAPDPSSCNDIGSAAACAKAVDDATHDPCVWCVAGAVPSECVSPTQAAQLPPGVFECATPSTGDNKDNKDDATKTTVWFDFSSSSSTTNQPSRRRHGLTIHQELGNNDLCDASSKSVSGYMDIQGSQYDANGEDKHLFFWMFEKRHQDEHDEEEIPLILWLTGGPGCSSTMALLTENGPCSVNPDGNGTTVNPYSWTETAHVIWLDQPAGVGFSYGAETDSNEAMIAEDVYYFLQALLQTYAQYQSSPLYIVGESYAGHYVPAIAHRIYQGNQGLQDNNDDPTTLLNLNLAGLSIGNGLTNPQVQYPWYPEMGVNNSHGIQIFDEATYETMKSVVPHCTSMIQECNAGDSILNEFACQSSFLVCNAGLTSPYQATGLNPYDIRIKCAKPPLCYDNTNIEHWLNLASTKQALGVDPKHSHRWETCNFGINMKFHSDWMHDFSHYVAELLNAGYPALIYAGDVDFICNYLGNQAWTHALDWTGQAGFQAATPHEWNQQGLARTYDKFTFLQVYNAGHMVPMDQPQAALAMMANFVHGGTF